MTGLRKRVIVCGGRKYDDRQAVREVLAELPAGAMIVTGGCPTGADAIVADEALKAKAGFIVEAWPAKWERYGRKAGPIRNQEIVNAGAEFCVAFPGGKGTTDCVTRCLAATIPVRHRG